MSEIEGRTGEALLEVARDYLEGEYVPKIRRCLDRLDRDDVWWTPNEACNSVGNLLLHLAGNTRQWIVSGVGGEEDVRRRAREFERGDGDPEELFAHLRETVDEACGVLEELDPGSLGDARTIQGQDVTVLEAVCHVVEHFSMHTGQIVHVTKERTGRELDFYRVEDGVAEENW